tara:strand:+ start:372 stop:650 length:279 start_codon:yes stop_codon:yes gene_type:complete
MQKHTKIFCNFWNDNLTIAQTYRCFGCDSWKGTDIHHISAKQSGGSKCKDYIENLTCLCRKCHEKCHKDKNYNVQIRVNTLRLVADQLEGEL